MTQPAVLIATAAVIGGLIRLLKSGWVQERLPIAKGYYPWIALGLGLAGAVVHAILHPGEDLDSYLQSILDGAVTGLIPVGVHELGTKR